MKRYQWLLLSAVAIGPVAIFLTPAHASESTLLGLVNGVSGSGGIAVSKDMAYGDAPLQNLDVYYPKALSQAIKKGNTDTLTTTYPLVVFVHGGSWQTGNKNKYKFVGESLAKAGYVTAVINYRKAPEHRYPDYVHDTAQAIAWTHNNASRFYADPNRMAVIGHSAGAFNVVAAVSNADFLAPYGLKPSNIKAVVGIAGPYSYDFRQYDSRIAFPEDGNPDDIMPDRLIKSGNSGEQPSYLLMTAEDDNIVNPKNTEDMKQALQDADIQVSTVDIKGASHGTIIGAMSTSLTWLNDVRPQVIAFLDKNL